MKTQTMLYIGAGVAGLLAVMYLGKKLGDTAKNMNPFLGFDSIGGDGVSGSTKAALGWGSKVVNDVMSDPLGEAMPWLSPTGYWAGEAAKYGASLVKNNTAYKAGEGIGGQIGRNLTDALIKANYQKMN